MYMDQYVLLLNTGTCPMVWELNTLRIQAQVIGCYDLCIPYVPLVMMYITVSLCIGQSIALNVSQVYKSS